MNTSAVFQALKESTYFDSLSDQELEAISTMSRLHRYESDELVFAEGDSAVSFYIVVEGQVQIYKMSSERKEIILHIFEPGDIFAEFPIFSDANTYPANAICMKPTKVLSIHGKSFKDFAVSKPEILFKMILRLTQRLRQFSGLIEDLSLRSVDSRLAKYLISISAETPDKAVIHIQKKTLASILGTIPETLSRAFKRLATDGIIKMDDQNVQIIDREALMRLSDLE